MSEVSASAQQSLDALLSKLGAKKLSDVQAATNKSKDSLGQEDFLKLMTTQLANQDPFAPQDNTQMIAQMAQFSTVTGIQQMNQTMTGVASEISQNRIATAASFVGKTVLVPGNTALADSTGGISGAVDLPVSTGNLTLQISTEQGQLVKTIDLGSNPAGLVGFSWDGKDDSGTAVGNSRYTIKATMMNAGKSQAVGTDVYGAITEASIPTATEDMLFTVAGAGKVTMSTIKSIKY